jgi:hypothetical protein
MNLAYCDAFASFIRNALVTIKPETKEFPVINGLVGGTMYDLHPTEGYMLSTKKTIDVTDANGKAYRISIEEL